MFKAVYEQRKSSLSHMTEFIMKRDLCKFNQTSDWDMRPLRKAQLHYAILDSVILARLYGHISKKAIADGEGEDILWMEDNHI